MIILLLIVFGLIFGSFVNALVWRFHAQAELAQQPVQKRPKKQVLSARQLSMSKGRSMCSVCHHELAPQDLIPLFSWLLLRGRCRYCHVKIEDSPLIEVFMPVLFVVSYLAWPRPLSGVVLLQFGFWLVFAIAFMALAAYDLRWFLLPDRIVKPLIGLALLQTVLLAVLKHDVTSVWQPVVAMAILAGLFAALFYGSGGAWIGGGDVKLAVVLGLLAGTPLRACLVLFLSSFIGTLASLPPILRGKKGMTSHIPFGPYLLLAMIIVQLAGAAIISRYTSLLSA